jgi:predicted ATPase
VTRFQDISIKGFRRLADVQLELRPLCVLIGANGIGKTSLLDVFSLLASSAQGSLNAALSELGGLSALITYDRAEELALGISMEIEKDAQTQRYSLRIQPRGPSYIIEREVLHQVFGPIAFDAIDSHGVDVRYNENGQVVLPTWNHNPLETSLAQVPKVFVWPEDFRRRLASSAYYHTLDVEARSPARLPQPMRPAALPGKNGEDLIPCLYYLREAERDRFDAIEDSLHAAFPGFERLDFPPVAAGTLALVWRDNRFSKPLYANQLSEGMLRFLWLVTLLQSPLLPAVTLIDEPEVSLHPELLSLLADLFREASRRTQLVVATHSDRLVRFLKPAEVVVLDSTDDATSKLTWADKLDLDEWLAEYSLDEVWSRGLLGARA